MVFKRVGYEPINIMVDSLENEIEIPYTILAESGEFKIGVFGITETETLPTLYSKDIKIRYGTDTHGTTPPKYEPSEIDQLRLSKQDKLTAGDNITIDENNVISAQGGSSGTTDYEMLENKPQINGVELVGNKSLSELGIEIPTKTSDLENDSGFVDDTAFENYIKEIMNNKKVSSFRAYKNKEVSLDWGSVYLIQSNTGEFDIDLRYYHGTIHDLKGETLPKTSTCLLFLPKGNCMDYHTSGEWAQNYRLCLFLGLTKKFTPLTMDALKTVQFRIEPIKNEADPFDIGWFHNIKFTVPDTQNTFVVFKIGL